MVYLLIIATVGGGSCHPPQNWCPILALCYDGSVWPVGQPGMTCAYMQQDQPRVNINPRRLMGFLPTLHLPSSSPSRPVPRFTSPVLSHLWWLPPYRCLRRHRFGKEDPQRTVRATPLLGTVAGRAVAFRKRGAEKGAVMASRRGLPLYSTGPMPR